MWAPHLSGEIALPLPDLWSEVKVSQSCLTLCNPMDYTIHGILQARTLEWVASPFYRDRTQVSRMASGFFISCATREAHQMVWPLVKPEDAPGHVDSSLNWIGEEGRGERRDNREERRRDFFFYCLSVDCPPPAVEVSMSARMLSFLFSHGSLLSRLPWGVVIAVFIWWKEREYEWVSKEEREGNKQANEQGK